MDERVRRGRGDREIGVGESGAIERVCQEKVKSKVIK